VRIDLTFERPEPEVAAEAGKLFEADIVDRLFEETCEVYNPRGELQAKYLRGIIPPTIVGASYLALREAATETGNRGYATGVKDETGQQYSPYRIKKDGTRSKTHESRVKVNSGIVGYFERYSARFPYCRQTAWTMSNKEKFMAALPMLQLASACFEVMVPERYLAQKRYVDETQPAWIIPGTVFTTVTVNSNWQTAQHQDSGDCRHGFGVMACLGHDFEGGWLVLPKYRIGFNMRPGDLILANVHEWHCNTPIKLLKPDGERLSLVMYYRENMEKCGTASEELEVAKNRQIGDPTWEPEAPLFR
jgi:hypothetical protein